MQKDVDLFVKAAKAIFDSMTRKEAEFFINKLNSNPVEFYDVIDSAAMKKIPEAFGLPPEEKPIVDEFDKWHPNEG